MSDKWYYVQSGERQGPVEIDAVFQLLSDATLNQEDYVWKKGFDNWVRIKDVEELQEKSEAEEAAIPAQIQESLNLTKLSNGENSIFIKIGADRGGQEVEYGPYSIEVIRKLYNDNRVNGKTYIFMRGMKDWAFLADFEDFSDVFENSPPPIADEERRKSVRKPFIARMYIESKKEVYVGVCRDVSVGGMQVLVDHFPGKIGDRISINVHPENTQHHFVASGEIVRVLDGGLGFSFRFQGLNNDSLKAIEDYIENGSN